MGIKHSMCGGSSMKKLYILFIVLFVLACTDSVTTRPDDGRNGQEESLFGWRWDVLFLFLTTRGYMAD